jgi:hypothetical protein
MPLTNQELKLLEKDYFDQIYFYLRFNQQRMIWGLESKNDIRADWWDKFTKSEKQILEFARGTERIFYWLLTTLWMPNSSPISSDLFFESCNAFIHIDIKTAKIDNPSDYKGKVAFGKNQTSYDADKTQTGKSTQINPNLPQYYNKDEEKEKPCLTYIIQLIHKPLTFDIIAILLISVPNGQLYSVYKNDIVGAGKSKDLSMRYEYKNNFTFNTLPDEPSRVKFIYFNPDYGFHTNDITTRDEMT